MYTSKSTAYFNIGQLSTPVGRISQLGNYGPNRVEYYTTNHPPRNLCTESHCNQPNQSSTLSPCPWQPLYPYPLENSASNEYCVCTSDTVSLGLKSCGECGQRNFFYPNSSAHEDKTSCTSIQEKNNITNSTYRYEFNNDICHRKI